MNAVTPTGGPAVPPPGEAKARQAARDFEAVFVGQMAKLMLEQVEQGEFSGGHGEEMFRSVLAEEIGRTVSAGRGIGLSDAVVEQLRRLTQEEGQ